MKEPIERLAESVMHLAMVDQFFELDPEYASQRTKMLAVSNFSKFMDDIYFGQDDRQMILGDVFEHIVAGRLLYRGYKEKESFVKLAFYLANQLMIQEHVILNPAERRRFMDYMENAKIAHFFTPHPDKPDPNWNVRFEETKDVPNEKVDSTQKMHYRIIDSLLPKSMGTAGELLVLAYLVRGSMGYVLPLLTSQRIESESGNIIAPPDYLLIHDKRVYGLEVGAGAGGVGKIEQGNVFAGSTSVPVLTVQANGVGGNISYRCPKCSKWILYCDALINAYSLKNFDEVNTNMSAVDAACPKFPECESVYYYGELDYAVGSRHYHYDCVKDEMKVKRARQKDVENSGKRRITHLPLEITGFEGLSK